MTSGKKKFSAALKLEIVQKYLNGEGSLLTLSSEYLVHHSAIQKWRDLYLKHGMEGLIPKRNTYSRDFKAYVVEYMHNTGLSLCKTAAHFNIPDKNIISKWERIYYEEGKQALYFERRGRKSPMANIKKHKPKQNVNLNEDLLEELQRLRMENEYLKKLNALIQKREKSKNQTT